MIVGLALAGGRSTRFGREKAVLDLGGRPMIAWVVDVLNAGCETVAINAAAVTGAARFGAAHGMTVLPDADGDPDGPLSGIKAGLTWARSIGAQALATSPCDTPFLPLDMVERLEKARRPHEAAIVVTSEGPQPSCALWPVSGLEHLRAALADGQHPSIRSALSGLGCVEVTFDDAWRYHNLNSPADHAMALSYMAQHRMIDDWPDQDTRR